MGDERKNTKTRIGVVVSTQMDKSAVIQTERLVPHKLYGKYMREHVKYMAHDPENSCSVGDKVMIEECRPLSKRKRWRVTEIIEKALQI